VSDVHVWGDTKKRFEVLKVAYKKPMGAATMNTETDIAARCREFTDALTEVLAENAIGLARRGRLARAHAAAKHHPEYSEHAFCVAVETAFVQWEALQNVGH
jgi:hypothetical protein